MLYNTNSYLALSIYISLFARSICECVRERSFTLARVKPPRFHRSVRHNTDSPHTHIVPPAAHSRYARCRYTIYALIHALARDSRLARK